MFHCNPYNIFLFTLIDKLEVSIYLVILDNLPLPPDETIIFYRVSLYCIISKYIWYKLKLEATVKLHMYQKIDNQNQL